MRTRLFAASLAALLLNVPTALAQAVELRGEWTAQEGDRTCRVTLADDTAFGTLRASSFACSGDLFGLFGYRLRGSDIALVDSSGRTLADLRLDRGGQLIGSSRSGAPVTLTRAGAPPTVPAPRGYVGPGAAPSPARGVLGAILGLGADAGCTIYDGSDRCVEPGDQAAPPPGSTVRTVAIVNLRAGPHVDADYLGAIPSNACVVVGECRNTPEGAWCRTELAGQPGWIAKVVEAAAGQTQRRVLFTNRCR